MANSVIGALRVMLGMDTAEFEAGATRAQRSAARFEKDMTKLGGNLQKVGAGMTLAITAPLAAFGTASFKAASDAAELQSAFNQTFGELAGAMNQWAEQTGDAMGRSTQSMQQLANTFGIFFNQAAPTREEAAKMSQTFAVLAQDLSSFYNVTESEALAKLRSGLSGESEPLRDFGVFLSEAAVQSKALEMGLAGVNNPLTEQEKIMARYAIILEATKNAQGDVARTADGTANQMRKAQAAFDELQVVVGTKLVPALTPLIEKLGAALEWFAKLPEPVQNFALAAAGISAAIGPVLVGIGSIITIAPQLVTAFNLIRGAALLLMANPVILAFAGVIAGIYFAWKNWDKITAIVRNLYTGVKTWLQDKLGAVFDWVGKKIGQVTGFFFDMYDKVVGNSYVPDMVDEIGVQFTRLQALMVDPAAKATASVTDATRQMASDVAGLLDRLFPQFAEARRQADELALLDKAESKGLISEQLRATARMKLRQGSEKAAVSDSLLQTGPLIDFGAKADELVKGLGALAQTAEVQTVRVAQSFQQMAENAISALDRMVGAIRGGDFLDILGGILNFGLQLGGMGVFGKKVQANLLQRTPGFANGGMMQLGGLAGVDRNVLSLNGSPIARVSAGETMQIRPANDRGGASPVPVHVTVGIDPRNGNVTAYVDGRIAATAPSIAGAGASIAQAQMTQAARRRVR